MMLKIVFSALEAFSSAVPAGLGAIVWLGYKIGPEMIAPMILAMFCGMSITNFFASFSRRPLFYVVRFFEISLLVGFIDGLAPKLILWGLADSPAMRLTWMLLICVLAAVIQIVFYSMRLQRLTRYIPAPVFAGFLNAVALILVISQIKQIALQVQLQANLWVPALVIAAICFTVAWVVKRRQPHLPAGVLGLLAASAAAFALGLLGHPLPNIIPNQIHVALPLAMLDGSIFRVAPTFLPAIFLDLLISGFLLAVVVFLNTAVASEMITQIDDKPEPALGDTLWLSLGQILSACLGSLPISGAPAASMAAMRTGGVLEASAIRLFCVLTVALYALSLMAWLPQTGMIGLLLFEASCLFDRSSMAGMGRYWFSSKARKAMSVLQREDLLTVALVTLIGVVVNMVAALLAGMVLGLVLFVKRNEKNVIKDVRTVQSLRSNCERSWRDTKWLDDYGDRIQCVRLQGALYFGIARDLRAELSALLPYARWLVIDWRAVTSQDTSLIHMIQRFEEKAKLKGVKVIHCARAQDVNSYQDLDRALEVCENELIGQLLAYQITIDDIVDESVETSRLFFTGLDADARELLKNCFETKRYAAGQKILTKGERTRDLYLITQGRTDVMIADGSIRVASVCVGAILGEMGFLDGTPRAADVVAVDQVTSHRLSHARFTALSQAHPEITQKVLQNLCTELANRVRSLHAQLARERQ
jgi:sulfate permease, SulP family